MRLPAIVDPTPEENAHARELCRRVLDRAVIECASALRNQPLSIRQLMGRLLIEDFAALDVNATRDWLDANDAENAAVHLLKEETCARTASIPPGRSAAMPSTAWPKSRSNAENGRETRRPHAGRERLRRRACWPAPPRATRARSPPTIRLKERSMPNEIVKHEPGGTEVAAPDENQQWKAAAEFVDSCIENCVVPRSFESIVDPAKRRGSMIVAIVKGAELGMGKLEALQSIYVVNGIPTVYGDAMVRYVMRTGLVESYTEGFTGAAGKDDREAWVEVSRKGVEGKVRRTFSVIDAQKQKLTGKQGPWQHSRDRMLMIRARTYAFRDLFSDAFPSGVAWREEAEDVARALHGGLMEATPTSHIDPLVDKVQRVQVIEHEPVNPDPPAAGESAGADPQMADGAVEDYPESSPADAGSDAANDADLFPGDRPGVFRFSITASNGAIRSTTDGEAWTDGLIRMFEKAASDEEAANVWRTNAAHVEAAEAAKFDGFAIRVRRAARFRKIDGA